MFKCVLLLSVCSVYIPWLLRADTIEFNLDTLSLAGMPNSALTFNGVLSNESATEVFLNAAGGSLSYSELTFDLTPFFFSVPLSLLPGESYSGPLFAVAISAVAQSGDYGGSFFVHGGSDGLSFDTLGSQHFQVSVALATEVPEPQNGLVYFLVLFVMVLWKTVASRLKRNG